MTWAGQLDMDNDPGSLTATRPSMLIANIRHAGIFIAAALMRISRTGSQPHAACTASGHMHQAAKPTCIAENMKEQAPIFPRCCLCPICCVWHIMC